MKRLKIYRKAVKNRAQKLHFLSLSGIKSALKWIAKEALLKNF